MDVSSEVSYVTLAGTCLGCIAVTNKDDVFFLATIAITLAYALAGALKTAKVGDNNLQAQFVKAHEYLKLLVPLLVLPALDTAIWMRYNVVGKMYGLLHAAAGILMSAAFLVQSMDEQFKDALVGVEGLSLLAAGISKENYYAMYADALFIAAYYLAYHYDGPINLPISKDDLYQYLLAGFMFFAMKAANAPKCPLH
ncbi:hypothetical protein ILUMI_20175 [Ignelater luminosus]|uniref:Uncharacterized protein n=1 Tax=Ignelater luminosus TaxID=2038154 RepID=A0A8K0CES3_IGNLU|nr:hypothetical protein ILUMI_20175 [Ignelater luminosus]